MLLYNYIEILGNKFCIRVREWGSIAAELLDAAEANVMMQLKIVNVNCGKRSLWFNLIGIQSVGFTSITMITNGCGHTDILPAMMSYLKTFLKS